jgi:hypothetical protein
MLKESFVEGILSEEGVISSEPDKEDSTKKLDLFDKDNNN